MSSSEQYELYDDEVSASKGILHRGNGHENPVKGFKHDPCSEAVFWIIVVFSFGLFYLAYIFFKVYSPHWAMHIRYKSVSLDQAVLVLVLDVVTNTYTACEINTVKIEHSCDNYTAMSVSEDGKSCANSSRDYMNRAGKTRLNSICEVTELKYLTFIYSRYIFSKPFNSFYPLTGLDGDNPLKRPEISLDGLRADDVLTLQKVYGPNEMKVNSETYLEIFAKNIVDPFYVFQLFTITVWVWSGYYIYSALAVLISVVIISIALRKKKREFEKLEKNLEVENSVTVVRDGCEYYVSHTELVPGDIVILNKSSHYFTFDGILVEGSAFVDNALLTGVTRPSYRYPDPDVLLQERLEKLTLTNHNNTIFAGTNMITPQSEGDVKALVVNIGFLTEKGCAIREESCENYSYSLDKDSMTYFKFLIVIGTIAFFVALLVLLWLPDEPMEGLVALQAALRLVTLAIPPSLPLALTIAFMWSMRRLAREMIATRNFRRIPVAGQVNNIVFDKTGTLTKNKVKYIGHLAVYRENSEIQLSGIDTSTDISEGDIQYLMATCHSVTPESMKSKEHTIDKELFRVAEWDMVKGEDGNLKVYSGKLDNLGEFKISFLRRFPFHSDKRTQSVVAEIEHENRVAYYINGMPQRVIECCKPKTVPPFTLQRIQAFTKQGYIVTAMAYKNLKEDKGRHKDLKDLQKDLVFLGLLVFGDTLADGAKEVIRSLNAASFTTLMCTGDNLDTAVYTARQVSILPSSKEVREQDRVVEIKASLDKYGGLIVEARDYDDGSEYKLSSAWGDYWDPPSYVINGETFQILDDFGGTELDRVIQAGKVFAEMTPKMKKHLVQLLMKMGHKTCMVGDGSNDNAALQAADVGISLKNSESGIAAEFYSIEKDIRSVPVLLNEGRTVGSQLLTIFMFTACYSILGMVAESLMYSFFYELSEAEWIYIDLILVMSIDLMLGYSESRETISTSRRSSRFFNSLRLFSMFCFLSVCIAVQISFLLYLLDQPWYVHVGTTLSELTEGSMEATYIFLLIIFQMTFPAIVYTMDREPVFKNRFMLSLIAVLYTVNTYFDIFPDKLVIQIFEFNVSPSMWFRVQVILISLANLLINIIVEIIFIINRPKN